MISILQFAQRRLKEVIIGSVSLSEAYTRALGFFTSLTDDDGIFRRVTDEYAAFLGYHPSELIGQHYSMVVTKRHQNVCELERTRYLNNTSQLAQFVYYLRHKQGHELPVTVDGVLITDEDGIRYKLAVIHPMHPTDED